MIKWKLAIVMAERRVKGADLAKALDVLPNAITNLRQAETMPRIDGERLNELMVAIARLSGRKVELSELMEVVDVE